MSLLNNCIIVLVYGAIADPSLHTLAASSRELECGETGPAPRGLRTLARAF